VARDIVSIVQIEHDMENVTVAHLRGDSSKLQAHDEEMVSARETILDEEDDDSALEDYMEMMRQIEETVMAEILELGPNVDVRVPLATCAVRVCVRARECHECVLSCVHGLTCVCVRMCVRVCARACLCACACVLYVCVYQSKSSCRSTWTMSKVRRRLC
jgi:hypothetical protein